MEKFDDVIWEIGKLITLLCKQVEAKEQSFGTGTCKMIAMEVMKSLISCLGHSFLQANVVVNTDVYFATKITTFPINVRKLLSQSQGKKLLNKNIDAFCA